MKVCLRPAAIVTETLGRCLLGRAEGSPASQAAPESTQKPRAAVQRDQSELSKPGKKNWLEEGPWKASRQHFAGLQPEDQCPSLEAEAAAWNLASLRVTVSLRKTAQAQGFDDPPSQVWCIPRKTTARALIAIVPDPVHSHLPLIFHRSLEALHSAGAATQYVMDRY